MAQNGPDLVHSSVTRIHSTDSTRVKSNLNFMSQWFDSSQVMTIFIESNHDSSQVKQKNFWVKIWVESSQAPKKFECEAVII